MTQLLTPLSSARYAQLRTFRRDGTAVDTPIWFALDGDTLVFRTKAGPKTRRIAANPLVEVWPCDFRGGYRPGTPTLRGEATLLAGAPAEAANTALHRRYGWQYNIVPLFRVPGVTNVKHAIPFREKIRRATSKTLWPDSVIVAVALNSPAAEDIAPRPTNAAGEFAAGSWATGSCADGAIVSPVTSPRAPGRP